jgi:hypothetical protein
MSRLPRRAAPAFDAAPARRFCTPTPIVCDRREIAKTIGGTAVATQVAMKKSTSRKLVLRSQAIRQLTTEALDRVAGGFIMKDTIIIRTGGIVAPPTQGVR